MSEREMRPVPGFRIATTRKLAFPRFRYADGDSSDDEAVHDRMIDAYASDEEVHDEFELMEACLPSSDASKWRPLDAPHMSIEERRFIQRKRLAVLDKLHPAEKCKVIKGKDSFGAVCVPK